MFDGPDVAVILNAIRERPNDGHRRPALASWLWDNDRDDDAVAIQVFWPDLRGNVLVEGNSVYATLRYVARHARVWAKRRDNWSSGLTRRRPTDGAGRGM